MLPHPTREVLRISSFRLEKADGVKSVELDLGGQRRKIIQEHGNNSVLHASFSPALEMVAQDQFSVLIKYRVSLSTTFLPKVVEVVINSRDVLSQLRDNKFRYQLMSKPGFVVEITAQSPAVDSQIELDLQHARAQIESELTARRMLEKQNAELLQALEKRQHEQSRALADGVEQASVADTLRQELMQVRKLAEEVKALEATNATKIAQLSEERIATVRGLQETHAKGVGMNAQTHATRAASEEVNRKLKEVNEKEEGILLSKMTEHDQQSSTEAEGHPALLELRLSDCKAELEGVARQLREAWSSAELGNADVASLREELRCMEHELKQARNTECTLRDDVTAVRASQTASEEHSKDLASRLADAQSKTELANAEAAGLREELHRMMQEVREAKNAERSLREELAASRALLSDSQKLLENANQQLEDTRISARLTNADAMVVKEKLENVEHQLKEAMRVQDGLQNDVKTSCAAQSEAEERLQEVTRCLKDARFNADVANTEVQALREALQRREEELEETQRIVGSLRDDLEVNRASQSAVGKHLQSVTGLLQEAQSSATSLREELQQVQFALTGARQIEQSLRDDLKASRVSQSETEECLENVTRQLREVHSTAEFANAEALKMKEELQRIGSELQQSKREADSLRDDLKITRTTQLKSEERSKNLSQQLKEAQSSAEVANADVVKVRKELERVEFELKETKRIEGMLRDDLMLTGRVSQADLEQRFQDSNQLVMQLLDVAITFRDTSHQALLMLRNMSVSPGEKGGEPASSPDPQLLEGPAPIDVTDVGSVLRVLMAFDRDDFLDSVNKVGLIIRRWQKHCKIYKERAKGKIAFRKFTQGDLALFLPTRNGAQKPWAAFNVSCPHYFLQANGLIAEQLKFREWIVARITNITERVVSHDDPESSSPGLQEGTKYYMVDVEDFTQAKQTQKKQDKGPTTSADPDVGLVE